MLVAGQLGHLQQDGFDVTVASRRADPDRPPAAGTWDHGVKVEHLPFVRQPSPLADTRALWATIRLIRRVRPAVVHASTPKAALLGTLAAWICRVPVRVHVVRGLRFETTAGWSRRLLVGLEWLTSRLATIVIFNSQSLLQVGEDAGIVRPGTGQVLGAGSGNGIDVDRFVADVLPSRHDARRRFGLPSDARVIGFVGRFTSDKGIEDLLWAFEHVDDAPWLLLVGRFEDGDPVPARIRATIESHERIVVIPWLDDTRPAYRAMDVLAFPSRREGLPNVPLEAQLCGVPVVAAAATGTVDALAPTDSNTLVDVGDRMGLARQLAVTEPPSESTCAESAAWVAANFDAREHWRRVVAVLRRELRHERA